MAREIDVQLIQYRDVHTWTPRVGDIIIKHGWAVRTKWFGVVNFVSPEGVLNIIKDGMMRLLVTTAPEEMRNKAIEINQQSIKTSTSGSYTVMQNDDTNMVVWYV